MKSLVSTPMSAGGVAPPVRPIAERPMPPLKRWIRRRAGSAWLNLMFFHSRRFPWVVRRFKPFWMWGAWTHSYYLQDNILANARRLLGASATPLDCDALGRAVVSNFFDFISDVGKSIGQSQEQLLQRIDRVEGETEYNAARREKKGAIILTAHMGSFEVGMAALLRHEKRVHVLFRRDSFGLFEKTRSDLRRQLGVIEECVDEGLPVWVRLREALANDDVVLIQGDRVMPGQKGRRMPVLGGHMVLPTGPVRLALATGAPIVPIFSVRLPDGKIRMFIEPPVYVGPSHPADAAMESLRSTLEKYLREYPEQWLMIHRAWCEDATELESSAPSRVERGFSRNH